jgi:hypothetical protein
MGIKNIYYETNGNKKINYENYEIMPKYVLKHFSVITLLILRNQR